MDNFIQKVARMQAKKKALLIAVSEGVKLADGRYVCELADDARYVDALAIKNLTEPPAICPTRLAAELGGQTRSIELSTLQRCAGHVTSRTDITEAFQVDGAAAKAALRAVRPR